MNDDTKLALKVAAGIIGVAILTLVIAIIFGAGFRLMDYLFK